MTGDSASTKYNYNHSDVDTFIVGGDGSTVIDGFQLGEEIYVMDLQPRQMILRLVMTFQLTKQLSISVTKTLTTPAKL